MFPPVSAGRADRADLLSSPPLSKLTITSTGGAAGRERDNSSFITTEFLLCSIRDLMSSSGGGSIVGSWVWQDDDEDLR